MPKKNNYFARIQRELYIKRRPRFQFATLNKVEVELHVLKDNMLIEVSRKGDRFIQRATDKHVSPSQDWGLDGRALVDVFQRVHTEEQLANFLSLCGPFRFPKLPQEVTISEFVNCQDFIRSIREGKVPIAKCYPSDLTIEQTDRILWAPRSMWGEKTKEHPIRQVMLASTALETIGATLFVDRLNGVIMLECDYCHFLYNKKSEHVSRFCSHLHRHLAAQNLRRGNDEDYTAEQSGKAWVKRNG